MTAIIRNQRVRNNLYQAAVLVAALMVLVSFVVTARQNLIDQGIATGFDFLYRSTGWDISFALMDYSIRDPYWKVLLIGFENSILVGLMGLFFATIFGTLIGVARVMPNPVLNLIGTIYVEIFRNIPLILQGFFWYGVFTHLPRPRQAYVFADAVFVSNRGIYFPFVQVSHGTFLFAVSCFIVATMVIVLLPKVSAIGHTRTGRRRLVGGSLLAAAALTVTAIIANYDPEVGLFTTPVLRGLRFEGGVRLMPEFTALLTAIVFFGSAYIAEIVRGGLLSVDKGQLEAAEALGLKPFRVYWQIRIPLALRAIMPPMGNQFVWLMKATTIGIAIGFSDLFMVTSTAINQSGQTIELLFIMMAGFLLINYTIGSIMNAINRSIALKGHETGGGK
ncbi:MAG: amino acid ABC transporter permease [Hyphomicrobiaceae bacterium]